MTMWAEQHLQSEPCCPNYHPTFTDLAFRKSSAKNFLARCDEFNTKYVKIHTGQRRVKIAVLDTGFNKDGIRGSIDGIKRSRKAGGGIATPIAATKSFFETASVEDECGHGTRVLSLLLRVAPNADFYVAKVSRTMEDDDQDAISRVVKVFSSPKNVAAPFVDSI